jgi:hypothetical protein
VSEARKFLKELFEGKDDDQWILLWVLGTEEPQSKQSLWFQDVEKAADALEKIKGKHVFIGLGTAPQDCGPHRRCLAGDITAIVGLWVDLDMASKAHDKPLPRTVEEAKSLLPASMLPSFLVFTGWGIHAYWLFKEMWRFDSAEERERASRLWIRWATLIQDAAKDRGWQFDRLTDLARVARVPGTQNLKVPGEPKLCRVLERTGLRYNPSDIEDWLDDHKVPDELQQAATSKLWAEKFGDVVLAIDQEAAFPEDVIQAWMKLDPRFRATWMKARFDFIKDTSQSAYDLALANFGLDAGLTEQQIVDLICQHRRMHHEKARTREKYFQDTIARAWSKSGGVNPALLKVAGASSTVTPQPQIEAPVATTTEATAAPAEPPAQPAETPAPSAPATVPAPTLVDPALKDEDPIAQGAARARMTDEISKQLGVRVGRLIKVTGKEPSYLMELPDYGLQVEFSSYAKFTDYKTVKNTIGAATDEQITPMKPKQWYDLTKLMLKALVKQDGGEETAFEGGTRVYLRAYLASNTFIKDKDDATTPHEANQPTVIKGRVAICVTDFGYSTNKHFGVNHSSKAFASMLTGIGAEVHKVGTANFRDQNRWLLPKDQFPPSRYVDWQVPEWDGKDENGVEIEAPF